MRISNLLLFIVIIQGITAQSLSRKDIDFYIGTKKLLNPLTGGVNNAQLSQGDLNLDGLSDILIFDKNGDVIMPLIYNKELKKYLFEPLLVNDFPSLKDWVLLKDFNKDGIIDIFSSSSNTQGIDGIEVYKGYIDNGKLKFKLTTNGKGNKVLRWPIGSGESQIYVSPFDVPTFTDVDGDGDLDILTFGNGDVHVEWYRNLAVERGWSLDSLKYELETDCYGGFREGGFTGDIFLASSPGECNRFQSNTPRHSGSTLLSIDLDLNGLEDMLIGDISSSRLVAVYNNGSKKSTWMNAQDPTWNSNGVPVNTTVFPSAFELDFDKDQVSDIAVTPNAEYASFNINNISLYKGIIGTKAKDFIFQSNDFLVDEMLDFGAGTHPCFVDYNQDGLQDLLVGTEGIYYTGNTRDARLIMFENKGTSTKPEFYLVDSNYLNFKAFSDGVTGARNFTPCFGDIDGDGDLDMVCGENNGALFFSENIAGPGKKFIFKQAIYNYMDIQVNDYSVPFLIDLNRDGLLDIVCGIKVSNSDSAFQLCSSFNYFQNQGSKTNPIFNSAPNTFPNTKCVGNASINGVYSVYSAPVFQDFKGVYKMFAGGSIGQLNIFGNIEGNIYNSFNLEESNYGDLHEGSGLHIALADIDDDGILDMAAGNERGGLALFNTNYKTDGTIVKVNEKSEDKFEIYPNPAQDYFIVSTPSDEEYQLEILGIDGSKALYKGLFHTQEIHLLDRLQSGIYIVKINQNNKIYLKKLVKY
ncbi:MAG: T9SS type A sorting domain-containing protein [Saprospiraceae bacterium]